MALAAEAMGGGLSAGQARALGGHSNSTVSAAGTTQATATALKTSNAIITTCANNAGVIVPLTQNGDSMWIYNGTANTLIVYPPTSGQFNDVAVNTGISVGTHTTLVVKKITSTRWLANLSA